MRGAEPEQESIVDAGYVRMCQRMNEMREKALLVSFDDHSRILLMNDFHMGLGQDSSKDDFWKNYALCLDTVRDYRARGFHFILPGDLIDVWENGILYVPKIEAVYSELFNLLKDDIWLPGNHDNRLLQKYGGYEAVLLKHRDTGMEILIEHGNKGDIFTDELASIGEWATNHWGQAQEFLSISDPTIWKKERHDAQEERLIRWTEEHGEWIGGHTHDAKQVGRYHNGGSWVGHGGHGVAIEEGQIQVRSFS